MKKAIKVGLFIFVSALAAIVVYVIGFVGGYKKAALNEAEIAASASRILFHAADLIQCGKVQLSETKLRDSAQFYDFYSNQVVSDLEKVSVTWAYSSPEFFLPLQSSELETSRAKAGIDCESHDGKGGPD